MSRGFHWIAGLFTLGLLGTPEAAAEQDIAWVAGEATSFESVARNALNERVSLVFDDVPLAEFFASLEQATGVAFRLDRKALADAGVGPETTVSLSDSELPLRSALWIVLSDLDLTWVISGRGLLITTKTEAENMLVTRVYDVEDLIRADGGMGELIEMLTSTLDPDSWDDTGGPGTIKEFRPPGARLIVVTQNQEIHEQIAELLAAIRRVRRTRPAERTIAASSRPQPKTSRRRARAYVTAPEWSIPRGHE
jgi:hypothetical protein